MIDLDGLRKEITETDKALVDLFEKRMELAKKVAIYKVDNDLPVYHPEREKQVIKKVKKYLDNELYSPYVEGVYEKILEVSKAFQNNLIKNHLKKPIQKREFSDCSVGYAGHKGSFSEQAALAYFKDTCQYKNLPYFRDVFEAVRTGEIEYGILPAENSSTGSIADVYDLLREYGFYITGEEYLKVEHNLVGIPGSTIDHITHVYSHEQGFLQSNEFLEEHRDWELIPYINTATSAKYVMETNEKQNAAISSVRAAELYGLEVLKANINATTNNYTRFVIIEKEKYIKESYNKTSIIFTVKHIPGALYKVLRYFFKNDINVMKIESRPIKEHSWEYFFYLDFEGTADESVITEDLKPMCSYVNFLGSY